MLTFTAFKAVVFLYYNFYAPMKDCEFEPKDLLKLNKDNKKGAIKIRNLTLEGRAYKIKTTRPRDYVVKPSMGIIMPLEEISVDVKASENCLPDESHRFLIEIYAFDCKKPLSSLKSHLKDLKTTSIISHKLGVVFYVEEDSSERKKNMKHVSEKILFNFIFYSSLTYIFCVLFLLLLNIFRSNVC